MLTKNVMVVCKTCNNKVPIGELKADDTGRWICFNCFQSRSTELISKGKNLKTSESAKKMSSIQTQRMQQPVKMQSRNESKFFCKICGYRFVRKGTLGKRTPEVCPYCSRKGVVVSDYTAQDIITESSKLFEF